MIRFALIAASTLGFFLTAALGNLMVPLLRAFQGRWDEPKARQTPSPKQEAPDAEPERPPQAPTMGGLCLMVGVLTAVGVGWTAACVAQPELLGAESLFSVRLLTALLGALLFGGVGLLEDLARIRSRSVLGLRRHALGWKPLPVPWCWCCWEPKAALQPGSPCRVWAMSIWALQPRCCGKGCWSHWPSVPALPMAWTASSAARPLRPCWA